MESKIMISQSNDIPDRAADIRPLLIDAKIPTVRLRTMNGESFDVNATVRKKPTILLFFRGGWCGFCKKQLVELRQHYSELATLGYQVIAISPDTPRNTRETVEKFHLPFPVLSDADMRGAAALGVAFRVTDRDDAYYEKLRVASGESHRLLPVPSYFIVGTDEIIKYEYINPNYRVRPPYELMVAGVRAVLQMESQAEN
jgi:peroxiredoxin